MSFVAYRATLEYLCAALQVCISVQDTGCGIPPEQHEVIFEAFNQVSLQAQGGHQSNMVLGTGMISWKLEAADDDMHKDLFCSSSEEGQTAYDWYEVSRFTFSFHSSFGIHACTLWHECNHLSHQLHYYAGRLKYHQEIWRDRAWVEHCQTASDGTRGSDHSEV